MNIGFMPGVLATMLDGYLCYMLATSLNNQVNITNRRLLLFIAVNTCSIFLIKTNLHLRITSIMLSALILLLLLLIFYGFKRSNFLVWIIYIIFSFLSEFVAVFPFMIFPSIDIVSVLRDDNGFTLLAAIISKFLMFTFVFLFCRFRGSGKANAPLSFSQILLFIICLFLIFCVISIWFWSLTGVAISTAFVIMFTLCAIAFLLIALYNIDRIMKHAQEKEDFALMDMQVAFSQEVWLLVDKMHEMKHDYRHHLQALHTLLDKELYEEANVYYNNVVDEFIDLESRFIDNQPIITSLLLRKLHASQNDGIKFVINVPSRLDTNIKGTDLCVIFSNLLDNAFEACLKSETDKYVDLCVSVARDTFFIDIENATGEIIENKNGIFKSTKPEPLSHGYGLRSVSSLVSKYDGEIKIYPNNSEKIFKVSIALPLMADEMQA